MHLQRKSKIEKLLESKDIEEKYQDALDKIKQHQQIRLMKYEVTLFVIFGSLFLNLISSALYDIIISNQPKSYIILYVSSTLAISLTILSYYIINKYRPESPVDIGIYYNIDEIYEIDWDIEDIYKIKHAFKERKFSDEDFKIWHKDFKNEFMKNAYFRDLKYVGEKVVFRDIIFFLEGFEKGVKFRLEVLSRFTERMEPLPSDMAFGLNYQILNPASSSSQEFLSDYVYIAELIAEHHIIILDSLIYYIIEKVEPYCTRANSP